MNQDQANQINQLSVMLYKKVLGTIQNHDELPDYLKGYTCAYDEVVEELQGTLTEDEEGEEDERTED